MAELRGRPTVPCSSGSQSAPCSPGLRYGRTSGPRPRDPPRPRARPPPGRAEARRPAARPASVIALPVASRSISRPQRPGSASGVTRNRCPGSITSLPATPMITLLVPGDVGDLARGGARPGRARRAPSPPRPGRPGSGRSPGARRLRPAAAGTPWTAAPAAGRAAPARPVGSRSPAAAITAASQPAGLQLVAAEAGRGARVGGALAGQPAEQVVLGGRAAGGGCGPAWLRVGQPQEHRQQVAAVHPLAGQPVQGVAAVPLAQLVAARRRPRLSCQVIAGPVGSAVGTRR